jgi:hypothetical protein
LLISVVTAVEAVVVVGVACDDEDDDDVKNVCRRWRANEWATV